MTSLNRRQPPLPQSLLEARAFAAVAELTGLVQKRIRNALGLENCQPWCGVVWCGAVWCGVVLCVVA